VVLAIENISKSFGSQAVLQHVSFSIYSGEVLGLIGPNGSGKTTLLECIAGILPPDAGGLSVSPGASVKESLFYMPDGIVPWADQRVRWALRFFERLFPDRPRGAPELASSLQLEGLMNARLGTLSKGERKRTLLALALLTPHPLLLLDEPFDGLDLRQTREVMSLLREQVESGRTLMLSIHQLTDAGRVCDRLVLLAGGKVVGEGTIEKLREKAKLTSGGLEEIFLALT
jgi:ABC-2 type transport system ATP-binding protein